MIRLRNSSAYSLIIWSCTADKYAAMHRRERRQTILYICEVTRQIIPIEGWPLILLPFETCRYFASKLAKAADLNELSIWLRLQRKENALTATEALKLEA